jgi:dTDP-glucose 4,6-dehydratase
MRPLCNLLVTGGAGFIGSAFIRATLRNPEFTGRVVNLDALTYAVDPRSLDAVAKHPRYRFLQGDINQQSLVEKILEEEEIDAVVHFAAETHVDRSIVSALPFIEANVKGTLHILEAVRKFPHVHFHHVSTDEVYGSLGKEGGFSESSPYRPNSPYAASKAASDHLVRAYAHTYGISTTLSHCSNNYGPFQHREKFVPLMISRCIAKQPLPVYGTGANVRDWLYVDDHVEAIWAILRHGKAGETYDIGANAEMTNLQMLELLFEVLAAKTGENVLVYHNLIRYVPDRPGHDFRYAIKAEKIGAELGWTPTTPLRRGLEKTVEHYRSSGLEKPRLSTNLSAAFTTSEVTLCQGS